MTHHAAALDPTTRYPRPPFPKQEQNTPGLAAKLEPTPDHGEESYRGSGKLTDLVAVITGADSGIGRAAAIAFAREGADVVLSYLPSEQSDADEVVALVEQAGRTAVAFPGDLTSAETCRQLIATTVERFGRIDSLVVVAGEQQAIESIEDIDDDHFDSVMKTNVYALFWLVKAAVPHIPAGGTIITTSSVQAFQPSPNLVDYASTKAQINNFSKGLAGQLAPKGIRVNVVAPGPVWTPLQTSGGQPSEDIPEFGGDTPLGRPGQPVELAGAYVYLASGESSYVTGSTISVTGGMPTP